MPSLFPSLRGRARGEAFNKMNRDTALVVFSGGQDSTTCLFWAKREFKKVYALSFLYGQKHQKEVDLARAIARKAGVEFEVMDVSFIGRLGHNSLTDAGMEMDQEKPADSFPNTFVPGRNLFFLSIAAVYARERGISHIVTGGVADRFQRLSRLPGCFYQVAECDIEPCHGRAVRASYSADVD